MGTGYLVVRNYASAQEVRSLQKRAQELLDAFEHKEFTVFSSKNQDFMNNYFKQSAGNISYFFEEDAFNEDGSLVQDKVLSINKIGHALHDLDPVFRSYSRSSKAKHLLESLGVVQPTPVQSMYICKQPRIGGEVVPHQDNTFLHTDPPTATGLWLALEDATLENGCLFVLPKSHTNGIDRRFLRNQNDQTVFDGPPKQYSISDFKALEVPAGTLVVLHGSVVHASNANTSSKSRHAYTVHYIDGTSRWEETNWLQRSLDFPFESLGPTDAEKHLENASSE